MDDTFTCDWCGQNIAVDRKTNAVVIKCTKCGKSLMVPPAAIQTETPQMAITNPVKPLPGLVTPPATPNPSQTKQCPFCGKPMGLEAEVCKSCGFAPSSWNPQGTTEKAPEIKRKISPVLIVTLALAAIALLGIIIHILTAAARQ